MFQVIEKLKAVTEQKKTIEAEYSELSKPIITDINKIPVIWEWFRELATERSLPGFPVFDNAEWRRKFIFIVLALYSPSSLIGSKMPSGLRRAIAVVLNVSCGSFISDNSKNVIFMYETYGDFRADVDYFYSKITERLK